MLPQRKTCIHPDCKRSCAAFCGLDVSQNIPRYVCHLFFLFHPTHLYIQNAQTPTEDCISCGHSYFNHTLLLTESANPLQRGVLLLKSCGGFFPVSCPVHFCDKTDLHLKTSSWSMDSICVCGGHWREHDIPYVCFNFTCISILLIL